MRKEVSVVLVIALLAALVVVFYYTGGRSTGYAGLEDYTEEDCVSASYTWINETNAICTNITDCTLCITEDCSESCQTCENVTTGECVGCDDDHLDLCLDETNCTDSEGYWYNDTCNAEEEPSCSNDMSLCLNETDCDEIGGGYWYDSVCNEDEEEEETSSEEKEEEKPAPESKKIIIPKTSLSVSEISNLSLNPGSSQDVKLIVKNTGTNSLISCMVKPVGESDS